MLQKASRDASPQVREDTALAAVNLPEGVLRAGILTRLSQDRDAFVQRAAVDARQRLPARTPTPEEDRDADAILTRRLRELERRYGRAARQELEAALRSWLALSTRSLAHELIPIHSAILDVFATQVRREGLDEDPAWRECLEKAERRFQMIDRIMADHRDYVRAVPLPAELTREDVAGLLGEACDLARKEGTAEGAAVKLETDVAPGLLIEVSRHRLLQALRNLVQNAYEAIGPAVGRILVSAARVGDEVVIRVRDTGPGIPGELLGRKLFFPGGSTKPGHTGFGLANAAQAVRDAGGWIEYESVEGAGATFMVGLPLVPEGESQ